MFLIKSSINELKNELPKEGKQTSLHFNLKDKTIGLYCELKYDMDTFSEYGQISKLRYDYKWFLHLIIDTYVNILCIQNKREKEILRFCRYF